MKWIGNIILASGLRNFAFSSPSVFNPNQYLKYHHNREYYTSVTGGILTHTPSSLHPHCPKSSTTRFIGQAPHRLFCGVAQICWLRSMLPQVWRPQQSTNFVIKPHSESFVQLRVIWSSGTIPLYQSIWIQLRFQSGPGFIPGCRSANNAVHDASYRGQKEKICFHDKVRTDFTEKWMKYWNNSWR